MKKAVLPVPLQSLVVEAVEEVRLCAHGSHVRVDAQELQQSPRAALLHPDDDGLRELLAAEAVRDGNVGGPSRASGPVQRRLPDRGGRGAVVRIGLLGLQPIVGYGPVDVVDGCGQGVTISIEAVEQVGEEKEHGKEDRQLGLRPQGSEVERSSPFTPSHGS